MDACKSGEIRWDQTWEGRGPNLDYDDFWRWLAAKEATPIRLPTGKVPRIIRHLTRLFPDGVPDPANCSRKVLKADLIKLDPGLAPPDEQTLKTAADRYNEMIRNRNGSD